MDVVLQKPNRMEIEDIILSLELLSKIHMGSLLGLDMVLFEIPDGTEPIPLD